MTTAMAQETRYRAALQQIKRAGRRNDVQLMVQIWGANIELDEPLVLKYWDAGRADAKADREFKRAFTPNKHGEYA